MASPSTTPPLHILRGLLRFTKSSNALAPGGRNDTMNATQRHIISQYRMAQKMTLEKSLPLRKVAFDFYQLRKDLKERARLHELDSGAESQLSPKELSRLAAARAGLQLPEEYKS